MDDVLPGQELREALRRLAVIRYHSDQEHLTASGLERASQQIVASQYADIPEEEFQNTLLELTVKCLRTGYAAGSAAQCDPSFCEFVWNIPQRAGRCIKDIVGRAMVGAPRDAIGKSVVARMEHPLLRLARELYPRDPAECEVVLEFLRGQLCKLLVTSENECPASEMDLVEWIAAGQEYGRKVKPEKVQQIFQESDRQSLEGAGCTSVLRRPRRSPRLLRSP